MARRKCDAAHSPTSGQRNGTKKTSSADAWTSQKITICTSVWQHGSDLSQRAGDRNPGRA